MTSFAFAITKNVIYTEDLARIRMFVPVCVHSISTLLFLHKQLFITFQESELSRCEWAFKFAVKAISVLEEWTGTTFPMEKLDFISVQGLYTFSTMGLINIQ